MQKAVISVKKVWPPDGRGPHRVQTIANEYYKVWRELADAFVPGGSYDITYDSEEYPVGSGKMQHTIKKAQQKEGLQPIPIPKTFRAETAPAEKNEIATLAIFKAFGGLVPDVETGVAAMRRAADIWQQFKRGAGAQPYKVQSSAKEDMDDDIPDWDDK